MPLKPAISLLCLLAALALSYRPSDLNGQEKGKRLAELKAEFRKEASKAAAPQLERYVRKLHDLEREAANARDYKLAIRIRDERMSAMADWERNEAKQRKEIALGSGTASLTGGVALDRSTQCLSWSKPGAKASWRLPPGIEAGAYTLSIDYASPAAESSMRIGGDCLSLSRKLPSVENETTRKVRAVRLSEGAASISIIIEGAGAPKFRLRSMTLTRLQPPSRQVQ